MSSDSTTDLRTPRHQALIAVSHIALDIQDNSQLPFIASGLLVDGLDSQSLRQSAGMSPDDYPENLKDTFVQAVRELNINLPTHDQARDILAREWARQIAHGEITPREGAQLIWKNVALHSSDDKYLIFAGLGDQWDSYPEQRKQIDNQITAAATVLATDQS